MLLSVAGDVLVCVYREVCSIRFLFTAVSLLSIFLAGEEHRFPGIPALLPHVCDLSPLLVTPTWSPTVLL